MRYLEFVYTRVFERSAKSLLDDDDMRAVELDLVENTRRGALERETGGVRKLRARLEGRGKTVELESSTSLMSAGPQFTFSWPGPRTRKCR